MTRYSLSLPPALKREAEQLARKQGISLNQFILWSVAEKVGALAQGVDDPDFPGISYRRGTSRQPTPVLRGTGIRVQTIAIAANNWGMSPAEIADEYDIPEAQIREAQSFYEAHRAEIDAAIESEEALAPK
ncbi:MAG: DUF433 domain-containing protein [Anaerolineales bacterium]|nr:DUF433 domain-containing protein [Anaerolineales bacterium]